MGEKKIKFCDNCNEVIDGKIYYKTIINRIDDKDKKSGKMLDGEFCEKCYRDKLSSMIEYLDEKNITNE